MKRRATIFKGIDGDDKSLELKADYIDALTVQEHPAPHAGERREKDPPEAAALDRRGRQAA